MAEIIILKKIFERNWPIVSMGGFYVFKDAKYETPQNLEVGKVQTMKRVGPDYLYAPLSVTGAIDTSDISKLVATYDGETYSQHFRNVPESLKAKVRARDGLIQCTDAEVDHLIPKALGGRDAIENLWCQPVDNLFDDWLSLSARSSTNMGFHQKDKLEAYIVREVKAGHIPVLEAQKMFAEDWVAGYLKYQDKFEHTLGATNYDPGSLESD